MIKNIEEELIDLINKRLLNNSYTAERGVTYTFFYLLAKNNFYEPHELLLEYPHSKDSKEKVDTYVKSTNEKHGLVMECKYDRIRKSHSDRTAKAGRIFKDLFRLAAFKGDVEAKKIFIYLTDEEMSNYLNNKNNGLHDFFNLNENDTKNIIKYFKNNKTFIKELLGLTTNKGNEDKIKNFKVELKERYGIDNFDIKCLLTKDLERKHKIIIFEVIVPVE